MTAEETRAFSQSYLDVVNKRLTLTSGERCLLNGLIEFLVDVAALQELPQPGVPYTGDLVEDARLQTKLDCERDEAASRDQDAK